MPEIPEETDATWETWRADEYTIRSSVQEFSENQAYIAHFYTVHGAEMDTYELDAKFEGSYLNLETHSTKHGTDESEPPRVFRRLCVSRL